MSYSNLFNEKSAIDDSKYYVTPDPARVDIDVTRAESTNDAQQVKEKDTVRHLQLSQGGNAEDAGLQRLNNASDETGKNLDNQKKKDAEAVQRQMMLNQLLDDLRETMGRIGAAIDATQKIKDLLKKKKFDMDDPDHFQLLMTAGIEPDTVNNGELTEEFVEQHLQDLRKEEGAFNKSIEQAETLSDDDPDFYKKIDNIKTSRIGDDNHAAYHTVLNSTSSEQKKALAATGLSKDQQDDFLNETFSDDFGDDFSTERPAITASADMYGDDFANAPDVQTAFATAVTPESSPQEPAQTHEEPTVASTVSIDPMKLG